MRETIHVKPEEIVECVQVRTLKEHGVQQIAKKIERLGFLPNFPVLVTPLEDGGYRLLDGNHRLEAVRRLGLEELPAHITETAGREEELRFAVGSNEAAESAIHTTLVDRAESIWAWSEEGLTQEAIAEILGWSREKVKDYSALQSLDPDAWEIIGATFSGDDNLREGGAAPKKGAVAPFTERLLRDILKLTADQQFELVRDLAEGKFKKSKFKALAENYRARNAAQAWMQEELAGVGEELLAKATESIESGAYDKEWKSNDGPGRKLPKLVASIRDEWEQKTSIQLIHGDFYEEVEQLPAESIDLILTDPPYNVANERVFALEGRGDVSQDFGPWDKHDRGVFIATFDTWAAQFFRLLKAGGSCYIFCADAYLSHLRDALEGAGFRVHASLVWCKANPGTQIVQTSYKSAVEHIVFATKGEDHTFNWQGENEMRNWFDAPICGGHERIKDRKGNTLHPTQKPERVIQHLMEVSSHRGDMVFDGFMGVGSVPAVARRLGRKCIGIEQDKAFFQAAQRRIDA